MPATPARALSGAPGRSFWATAVATGLGSGFSPVLPGTVGSLVGLLLLWPLRQLGAGWQVAALATLFFLGVAASTRVAREAGLEDPRIVVVDEIVGLWASLMFLPFTPLLVGAGFVLFRVLDVTKPYPAGDLEDLPRGWGIMSDDLVAGVYVNLTLRAVLLALAPP